MTQELIKKYTMKIAGANPTEIIAIVYDIADTYMDEACKCEDAGDIDGYCINIKKAAACVNDLSEALDMQYEISAFLLEIYMYINKELSILAIKPDSEKLARIRAMMGKLKSSFDELASGDKSGAVMGNTEEIYAGLTYGKGTLNENNMSNPNRGFTV